MVERVYSYRRSRAAKDATVDLSMLGQTFRRLTPSKAVIPRKPW